MSHIWRVLAILTLARVTMGMQFQAVPALAEPLGLSTGLGPVAIGWLTGLYLLPGIVFSFAGGWLGARFGDLRMVRAGLAMMIAGGLIMLVFAPLPEFAGRIVAGTGAILLNVLVTKVVADTFPPERLPTAMGILVSSWPIGLALSLAVLPALEALAGLRIAMMVPPVLSLLCFGLMRDGGREARNASQNRGVVWPSARELVLAVFAGCVWAFYNVALIVLLAFGPAVAAAQGVGAVEAAAMVSLLGWALVPGLVAGGWIAAGIGNADATMIGCFLAIAGGVLLIAVSGASPWVWGLVGVLFGPAGGLIMALPARAVDGPARAIAFGVYFTVYYIVMPVGPPIAAAVIGWTGEPNSVLWVANAALGLAAASLVAYRMLLPQRTPITTQ